MTDRLFVQEGATLAPKRDDGTYPVVIITEGRGSTGVYSAELLKKSAHVFENVASFINHPVDPAKPHLRDLNSIAGRVSDVRVEERDGKVALVGTYKPRAEYATLFEQFSDIIGLSIFCGVGAGEPLSDGRIQVESFNESDPYRSIDAVVAAGRGGRFERATESLRAIESSLGTPEGNKPGVTSAPVQEGENMDEVLKAVEALTAKFDTFIAEQKVADEATRAAEADADAAEQEKRDAVEAYAIAAKAVSDAELLPSQEAQILEAAKAGKDVAPLIEDAKKIVAEAQQLNTGSAGYVIESAGAGASKASFGLKKGGRR